HGRFDRQSSRLLADRKRRYQASRHREVSVLLPVGVTHAPTETLHPAGTKLSSTPTQRRREGRRCGLERGLERGGAGIPTQGTLARPTVFKTMPRCWQRPPCAALPRLGRDATAGVEAMQSSAPHYRSSRANIVLIVM